MLKEKDKIYKQQELPIHEDGNVNPRFKCWKPFWLRARSLGSSPRQGKTLQMRDRVYGRERDPEAYK